MMTTYNFSLMDGEMLSILQEHVWFKGRCVTEVFLFSLDDDITRDLSMESPLYLTR